MNQLADAEHAAHAAWQTWRDLSGPEALVAAAVLAPSPHNTQPWRFSIDQGGVSPGGIEVSLDSRRRLGTADPTDREVQIALGCAIENLVLAAGAQGLAAEVSLVSADPPRVRVDLAPAQVEASALYAAIGDRHTNRGPYTSIAVSAGLLEDLTRQTAPTDQLSVRWLTDWADRDAFGSVLIDAAEAVVADVQQSEDYFRWFRSSLDQVTLSRDGLNLGVQGLGSVKQAIAKVHPPSNRTERDRFWLTQTRTVHTATASAYGLILSHDPADLGQRIAGGRLFERLQLAAAAHGLAFHPMSQVTQRVDRDLSLGRQPVFDDRVAEVIGTSDPRLLISFRVGYPVRPGRPSPRRGVKEFLD